MLHLLDVVAAGVMRFPRLVPRMFPDGWGDVTMLDHFALERANPPAVREIQVSWAPSPNDPADRLGTFRSPSPNLPEEAATARVLWVGSHHQRQVLLLAASNDHGWESRAAVARMLSHAGIGALILENPLYGSRRVRPGQPLATVVDFFRMGSATVAEARSLLAHLAAAGHTVGVAGFSQGGSVAAHVSALAPVPVATACMAAGPSPGPVFTQGVLTATIDWEALGGRAAALPRLRDALDDITVTRYTPLPHATSAVVAGGRRDAYVPPTEVERLAAHWSGAELVWTDGGHASFHLFGKRTQADLIQRAFDRFDRRV